ncbi:MAG: hypothetical protein IPM56_16230 [Ignavibacteriales bacterium]|nr:MAG: hypothetical protein IPM56_16230 [Ignavibacteriales bacterium]
MKRLIMFLITWAFIYSFIKVSIASVTITDIPLNWAFLLASFIGLGIADKYVTLKKNGNPETESTAGER